MKHLTFLKLFGTTVLLQLFFSPGIFGQSITVDGTVHDAANQLLAGVCVKVKGSHTEVFTDSTGYYSITATTKGKLVFSLKGFVTQKAAIKGEKTINILLNADLNNPAGKEINTGYGTVKESTSAQGVSSVDKKAIQQDNATDITQLLESVPSIKVINSGGELKVMIRGIRSLTGDNFALIVLNGSVFYGSLRNLNRNDIKSIDVLKDASSTAAYGSRGANGVVLITTK